MQELLTNIGSLRSQISIETPMGGFYVAGVILTLIAIRGGYVYRKKVAGYLAIDSIIGGMYEFLGQMLGDLVPKRVYESILTVFLIILGFNIRAVILDVLIVGFPELHHFHFAPTTDFNFTIALAIFSVGYLLYEEYRAKGAIGAISTYLPLRGSGYLIPKGKMPHSILDWIAKLFDIIISVFIGLLEVIGHFAKVISLGGRLFGNMWAGGLLLAIAVSGGIALTSMLPGDIPAVVPVIVHIQALFVACIQAFVFTLLLSIFIKLVYEH